tara:strand:- start:40 stop:153 length:114 start_codon:yes stop_codon:yes gene_type:complete
MIIKAIIKYRLKEKLFKKTEYINTSNAEKIDDKDEYL